jgi:uncharacterized membrane protein
MIRIPRPLIVSFLLFALLGFVDAAYLTASHYQNAIPPCYITRGCEAVTTSSYSKILSVPVALLGALYYASVFFAAFYYLDKRKNWILQFIFAGTSIGFLTSVWLLYVQGFLLEEFCTYCILSGITSTVLFSISLYVYLCRKNLLT